MLRKFEILPVEYPKFFAEGLVHCSLHLEAHRVSQDILLVIIGPLFPMNALLGNRFD